MSPHLEPLAKIQLDGRDADDGALRSCLQVAKAFGGRQIIAVDVSDEKLENALKMGATHTVNGAKENVVDKIKVS